jgi:hypothetical protein
MSGSRPQEAHLVRGATLKVSHDAVTAQIPAGVSREEFARVASAAFDLISKLTGHPCGSGRFRFVVDDPFLNQLTHVNLQTGQLT